MPRLLFETVPHWPPLAWLARCDARTGEVSVLHGSRVETADDWFCEAAWDGEYECGDFDRTDIVAGSGGRLRDGGVTFVSAGSTVDRLQSVDGGNRSVWVSNSLPCLLAAIGGNVDPTDPTYGAFFHSIVRGLDKYERRLPTSVGPVQLTYFDNLRWADGLLTVVPKPFGARTFTDFASYRGFLERSMSAIIINASSTKRRHVVRPLGTLSSGYDSTTVSTLAVKSGLQDAMTFPKAFRGMTPRKPTLDDTGARAAAVLGLRIHEIDGQGWREEPLSEVPFFAANAWGEDVHYTSAKDHLAGRMLLTGYQGDKVWAKKASDLSANIVRSDLCGLSLSEARLWIGFLHCPVPFWGVRSIAQIHRISNSAEMKPWDVPGPYSRPICRRIAEEAGIPRDAFGMKKRASSVYPLCRAFLSPSSTAHYLDWLRQQRGEWIRRRRRPPLTNLHVDRAIMAMTALLEHGTEKLARAIAWCTGWSRLPHYRVVKRLRTLTHPHYQEPAWLPPLRRYVFPWALAQAKERYASAATDHGFVSTDRSATLNRVVDDLSSGHLDNIREHVERGRVEFIRADLGEAGIAQKAVDGVSTVFHLAAGHGSSNELAAGPLRASS